MLELDLINASYGDLPALWNVSLKVDAGKIVALIGPNGAGKTTLLRSIVGLQQISSGRILVDGKFIHTLSPHQLIEQGIALVPEGRRLFNGMSVLENLQVGAHSTRAQKKSDAMLTRVFEIFPILDQRRHSLASTLSGGMQQMLAIGRALMGAPRLLLLDEPSMGLAPLVVKNIFDVIQQVNREGATILLVEQNARAALELAQDAYILEQGRIVGHDTGAAMLRNKNVQQAYLGYVALPN
ncbi:MAG: ABC transporter ATP-binding protein [Chloroflexi bacterium]|nr:ABC transporter ATP-binding protein [Chloroflexota bacterium]